MKLGNYVQDKLNKIVAETNCVNPKSMDHFVCLQTDTSTFIAHDSTNNVIAVASTDPIRKKKTVWGSQYYDLGDSYKSLDYNKENYNDILETVKKDIIKRKAELVEFKMKERIHNIKSVDV